MRKTNSTKKAAAEATAKKLDGTKVTVLRQAAEDGRLFGSVTVKEIAEHIEPAYGVDSKSVELLVPIKAVGIYKVKVALHAEVTVEIIVNVARTESEADNQFAADQKEQAAAKAEEQKSA